MDSRSDVAILIVNDDPDQLELLSLLLGKTYRVLTATNGFEGFEVAKRELPAW
ncbi:MAG: hypothetical protein WKF30_17715 [Pyrinomonadaceae bacterium]